VETGSTLSGGLDSSSIAAAIHGTGKFRQKTFSAVFPGYEKDESSYIEKVAARFDLANFSITPKVDELIGDFEKLCHYQEIPFTSSSIYLQYRVFGLAKEHGTKVLLDGQGADELFAGYSKYIHWYLQELFRKNPLNFLSEKRALNRNRIPYHWSWRNYLAAWFPAQAAIQLEKREARKIAGNPDINPEYNDQLYFNCFRQGLQDLLHYADRNSMAHGCEIRLPFLNHELIQFLFSLASSLTIHNGWTKYILRKTMEDQLPSEIVWRKDKIGFEPPQKTWMSDPQLQDYVQEGRKILVGEKILKKEVLNKKNQPMDAHAADNFDWRYLVTAKCIF
jgi:asparagine synthase (glutamine-hydrolysing)